jgi:hypothetical protein
VGRCLKGSIIIAKVIEVFMTILLNKTKDFLVSRVFKLDNYKYLIPYIWIYAAIKKAIVLAPLSEFLLDIIQVT